MSIFVRGEQLATVSPPPRPSSVVYNKGQLVQSTERGGEGHIITIECRVSNVILGLLSLGIDVAQFGIVSVWGKWELRSENRVCEGRGSCCRVSVCLVMSAESLEPIGGGDDSIRREGENGRTGASEMRLLLAFEAGERA